jgi:hypothetical protein
VKKCAYRLRRLTRTAWSAAMPPTMSDTSALLRPDIRAMKLTSLTEPLRPAVM